MTTLTDREKALVEAARAVAALWTQIAGEKYLDHMQLKMIYALRAYDPPKKKVYSMPEWEKFTELATKQESSTGIWIGDNFVYKDDYNAIREATVKEQE